MDTVSEHQTDAERYLFTRQGKSQDSEVCPSNALLKDAPQS